MKLQIKGLHPIKTDHTKAYIPEVFVWSLNETYDIY